LCGALVDVDRLLADAPHEPVASHLASLPVRAETSMVSRARAYLERSEPALCGTEMCHKAAFTAAQRLVRGFRLDEDTAYLLLAGWVRRGKHSWSERELRHKIHQAAKNGTMAPGALADAPMVRRRA